MRKKEAQECSKMIVMVPSGTIWHIQGKALRKEIKRRQIKNISSLGIGLKRTKPAIVVVQVETVTDLDPVRTSVNTYGRPIFDVTFRKAKVRELTRMEWGELARGRDPLELAIHLPERPYWHEGGEDE